MMRCEGLGSLLSEPFDPRDVRDPHDTGHDHNRNHAHQAMDGPSPSVAEDDWTALPSRLEEAPVVRTPAEIVTALVATPTDLERVLAGVSSDAMRQPAHDGEAAVVELVAHLRDWDAVVGGWVNEILVNVGEESPMLDVPDDSLWAIEHDYPAQDPHSALEEFRERRTRLLDSLADLSDHDWERAGLFAGTGAQTLKEILNGLCQRDAGHLQRIREALT